MSFKAGQYCVEDLIQQKMLEIGDGYRAKNTELSSSGFPFARAGNINDGFRFDNADCFPEINISKVGNKISKAGDVVFTSKGTVGRFALVLSSTPQFVYSPQLCFWRSLNQDVLLPEYLYYWMNSVEFLQQIDYLKGQTDMADYVSLRDQRKITATIPTTSIQREVVKIMVPIDNRIALLRETNATLEAIAQAIFKSWFVDFDPVHAKQEGREPEGMDAATAALFPDSFEESALGLVPKGWRPSTLGAICAENIGTIQTGPFGSQLHASDYLDEGTPVVMPQDLGGRRIKTGKIARVGDADVSRLHRHQMRCGDIVFSRRGDVGRHALIGSREKGWLCGTGCLLVRAGKTWPSTIYLSLALDRADAKEWLLRHAVGATMPNLNTGILNAVPIMQPDSAVLCAFDEIMRLLDDRISDGHARIHCLTELRDTLLPRLISGQLRLPDADALMKDAA
jgi:type I restriction enzyme S subunit